MSRLATHSPSGGGALHDLLRRRFGLVIHDHQQSGFEQAVDDVGHALGFPCREAYLQALEHADHGMPEVEELLAAVTVGESYFFRDAAQVEFIERRWIPDLVARKFDNRRVVRVWSAGCSHGQEIYSIAMLLDRHLPERDRWHLQLFGTDINRQALDAAARGHFREWSLRATPDWARESCFQAHGHESILSPRIRSMVRFEYFNLIDDRLPSALGSAGSFDLILCRNVFIYFHRSAIRSVMAKFAGCLDRDGVLLLGPADIVSENDHGLELASWNNAQYYASRQTPGGEPRRRVSGPASRPASPRDAPPRSARAASSRRRPPEGSAAVAPEAVEELLREEAWEAALLAADAWMAEHGEAAHMLERVARAQASLGRLDEAIAAAERALTLDPVNQDVHFIHGLSLLERDEPGAAEAALRRAIYLDHGHLEAHHQLGSLLLRQGRLDAGLRSLRNALAIAERGHPEVRPARYPGDTFAGLAQVLHREIAMHGNAGRSPRS